MKKQSKKAASWWLLILVLLLISGAGELLNGNILYGLIEWGGAYICKLLIEWSHFSKEIGDHDPDDAAHYDEHYRPE